MAMEQWNVLQFLQLLGGFLGVTVFLPALVFYRKVKRFPAAMRFTIYFTIGSFYVTYLVHVLELVYISYRGTLLFFTFVPAALAAVAIYRIPVRAYAGKVADELRHYVLRELGFRSFCLHRLRELRSAARRAGAHLWRLLKENWMDLPFLAVLLWVIWAVCGKGLMNNWGFGASDIPVHNYWINGLIENKLYIAGIYPMGMHCMLYYLATVLNIPVYVTLRLFWLIQYSMIVMVLLAFLKGCCKSRFLPYLGAIAFAGLKGFVGAAYFRYGATLPQEYGMMYILPSIFFVTAFFKAREQELAAGVNRVRCTSSWLLLGFAMSFSLTLTAHFYDTIIAGILCIGVAAGYSFWLWRREYFWRVMLAGVLSILMALLPMAAAFLTGKSLQGSMYWAMNVIGLRAYTVPIFRVLCILVVAAAVGGALFVGWGVRKGVISLENQPVPEHTRLARGLLRAASVLAPAAVLYLGWHFRGAIQRGLQQNSFKLSDPRWYVYGAVITLLVGLVLRCSAEKMEGAAILSMLTGEILLSIVLVSGSLGLPMLMEPARVCIYAAYMLPVVAVLALDGAVQILLPPRFGLQRIGALVLAAAVLVYAGRENLMRGRFGGGNLEMNEAILCTTNILWDNRGSDNKWTIVSANDELRMIEMYGRHTETIDFLEDMEHWNSRKEVTIPTDRVYFYIEKKPLNYANGYGGTIPEVSEEQAAKPLPANSGINAYNGTDRAVTMSRMYYWAQAFRALYPNEMKVYFENDRFVCYYIEQNPYSLYNFAIDYGYN